MLTDTRLKNLKAKEKLYKVTDRDGLYVAVTSAGTVSFRYDYSISGRRETVVLGKYGVGGVTLSEARGLLNDAKRKVSEGKSPSQDKARRKDALTKQQSFNDWAESWLNGYNMADSTRDMRRSIYTRDLLTEFGSRKLHEITHTDLRKLTDKIVARGAPATAVHARDIVSQVFRWAKERGEQGLENPADLVRPSAIASFEPRDRALSSDEIAILYEEIERVGTTPSIRAAVRMLLLTMVRKGEMTQAQWGEVSFSSGVWSIPKERMKRRNAHNVYLSIQALDILTALKTFAGGSRYVFPSRYDPDLPMSSATLNRVLTLVYQSARANGKSMEKFGPHDLRRTASTHLHEAGYNTDWIEKCLAHEQKGVRAVYNKAEYREQRAAMLQDWADMIDGWVKKG